MLASGGDDLKVLIHDVSQLEGDIHERPQPKASLRGNTANVFAIAFSQNSSKIFSSGVDGRIKQHDLENNATDLPAAVFGGSRGDAGFLSEIRNVRCSLWLKISRLNLRPDINTSRQRPFGSRSQ